MTQQDKEAIGRAAYLLRVVGRFIDNNPVSDYTVLYDEAQCDGACLRDDCSVAADELERCLQHFAEAEVREAGEREAAKQRQLGINPYWSGRADDSPRHEIAPAQPNLADQLAAARAERDAYKRQCDSLINDVISEAETQMARDARMKALGAAEAQAEVERLSTRVAALEDAMNPQDVQAVDSGIAVRDVRTKRLGAAEALREAKAAINPNVLGNGDYYAGMQAGIESACDTLEEMAQCLEKEFENVQY